MDCNALDVIQLIVSSISTILIVIYVIYTALTFRQIKYQNDLQTRAFLTVYLLLKKPDKTLTTVQPVEKSIELSKKWKSLINRIYNKGIPQSSNTKVYLVLKNRGKAAIYQWGIDVSIIIKPSKYLVQTAMTTREKTKISIIGTEAKYIIEPEEELLVAIVDGSFFPEFSLEWTIEYKDVRGNVSNEFGGDSSMNHQNKLLCDYDPQAVDSFKDDIPF